MRPSTSFTCGRSASPCGVTPRITTFDGLFDPRFGRLMRTTGSFETRRSPASPIAMSDRLSTMPAWYRSMPDWISVCAERRITMTLSAWPVATSVLLEPRREHEHRREHVDDERHAARGERCRQLARRDISGDVAERDRHGVRRQPGARRRRAPARRAMPALRQRRRRSGALRRAASAPSARKRRRSETACPSSRRMPPPPET